MEENPSNIIIKREKITPELDQVVKDVKDDIEKLLDGDLFREKDEIEDKKEIEPTK